MTRNKRKKKIIALRNYRLEVNGTLFWIRAGERWEASQKFPGEPMRKKLHRQLLEFLETINVFKEE